MKLGLYKILENHEGYDNKKGNAFMLEKIIEAITMNWNIEVSHDDFTQMIVQHKYPTRSNPDDFFTEYTCTFVPNQSLIDRLFLKSPEALI